MEIDFNNLTEEQKNIILRIGIMKIGETVFESLPCVDKLQRNVGYLRDKTDLSEEQIWECYEFISNAVIAIGKPKPRNVIGYNTSTN